VSISFNDYFYYDELSTSCLKWKVPCKFKGDLTGKDAGGLDVKGYFRVKIGKKSYKVHRIIYCLHNQHFNYDDPLFIDHIDGVRNNNTISNLRLVDRKGNGRNTKKSKRNSTGVMGVNIKSKGVKNICYRATWRDINGVPKEKSFSINKYGEELAFFMACEYREHQILLLNLQGAGYSENHGK